MLVLSRKEGESIIIGSGEDEILVKIAKIEKYLVKLAIEAPRKISIFRKEVFDSVMESNKEAALRKQKGNQRLSLPKEALRAVQDKKTKNTSASFLQE